MDLTTQIHLVAGIGALTLGGSVLLRQWNRARARLFGLLCAALALWNLGLVANAMAPWQGVAWNQLFLLGSCTAAPLGLHFVVRAVGLRGTAAWLLPGAAYLAAGLLWLATWTTIYQPEGHVAWNLSALGVLGLILLLALALLLRHVLVLGPGPERGACRLLLGGAVVAVVGGLSDFLPRSLFPLPRLGPVFLLIFMVIVCSIVVRHRFLDVSRFLARALALTAGAALATLAFLAVIGLAGSRFLPLFLATVLVLAAAGPVGKALLSRARSLLQPDEPVVQGLLQVSRRLTHASHRTDVWQAVREAADALPGEVAVSVSLSDGPGEPFRVAFSWPESPFTPDAARGTALVDLLERERAPLTVPYLQEMAGEARGERRRRAQDVLSRLEEMNAEMVAPLLSGNHLVGWIGVGGGHPGRYLTADTAAALLAVGNQAVASLERIAAVEEARQRQALAAVGEMAAGLAHEIRNPVGAIRGAAQVLAAEQEPRRAGEMLEVIEEETGRLGRVVGDFLDYARPASPRREPVELAELLRGCLRSAEAAGLGLHAEVLVAPGTPPALGDPDQLGRALHNLVRNAREAAGPDGSLRGELRPHGDDRVALRLEDNGPGIPPEVMSRLFQPFHTSKAGGTGLGLALVHRVIEAHGGSIRAEDRPGRGAAFTIVLPAAEETA